MSDFVFECNKCDCEFEIPEDSRYGGKFQCPKCGQWYDSDFDTEFGMSSYEIEGE